jgi:hypothetical protein
MYLIPCLSIGQYEIQVVLVLIRSESCSISVLARWAALEEPVTTRLDQSKAERRAIWT